MNSIHIYVSTTPPAFTVNTQSTSINYYATKGRGTQYRGCFLAVGDVEDVLLTSNYVVKTATMPSFAQI